jgi:ATP-dependent Zn protease
VNRETVPRRRQAGLDTQRLPFQPQAERNDAEIKSLIKSIEQDCRKLMGDNRERLERLAKRLLEAETLSREQIDEVMNRSHSSMR